MSKPTIEVWEAGPSSWRWLYRDPGNDLVLMGNRSHPNRRAALAAARTAYPGVRLATAGRRGWAGMREPLLVGVAVFAVTLIGGTLLRLRRGRA